MRFLGCGSLHRRQILAVPAVLRLSHSRFANTLGRCTRRLGDMAPSTFMGPGPQSGSCDRPSQQARLQIPDPWRPATWVRPLLWAGSRARMVVGRRLVASLDGQTRDESGRVDVEKMQSKKKSRNQIRFKLVKPELLLLPCLFVMHIAPFSFRPMHHILLIAELVSAALHHLFPSTTLACDISLSHVYDSIITPSSQQCVFFSFLFIQCRCKRSYY